MAGSILYENALDNMDNKTSIKYSSFPCDQTQTLQSIRERLK